MFNIDHEVLGEGGACTEHRERERIHGERDRIHRERDRIHRERERIQ